LIKMAKPKRIVLIRHGNSQANADKNIRSSVPDHRIALTEDGQKQALNVGQKLKSYFEKYYPDTVAAYVSPYTRTRQTYELIKKSNLNITREYEDPRIREQDFGHLRALEAFQLIDSERSAFGTFFYRIPDGESGADVYDRISSFLDTLWRDFEKADYPENTLIVSHGLTIRLFMMRWLHWSVEHFERLRNPLNCEYYILEMQRDGKYKLLNEFREYTKEEQESWAADSSQIVKPWMA
jgi:broad specificity phosphatase PhoE